VCRCGSTRRAQSAGGARRDLRVSDLHKRWSSDGGDVALFLPFGSSKERQRAAKPGIRRKRKTARFFAGGRKVRQRSAKGGKARQMLLFPRLQKPPRFGPVSVPSEGAGGAGGRFQALTAVAILHNFADELYGSEPDGCTRFSSRIHGSLRTVLNNPIHRTSEDHGGPHDWEFATERRLPSPA
jgi:hypothetical protein